MKVIKRDGSTVSFDRSKIENAIRKANSAVEEAERIEEAKIVEIAGYIESKNRPRLLVEDIQDMVEHRLMEEGKFVETGRTEDVIGHPKAEFTKKLVENFILE